MKKRSEPANEAEARAELKHRWSRVTREPASITVLLAAFFILTHANWPISTLLGTAFVFWIVYLVLYSIWQWRYDRRAEELAPLFPKRVPAPWDGKPDIIDEEWK